MKKLNRFKYTNSNKRYYTLDYFYKEKFNSKVFKVSLNAGFSCPNIDGKVGFGGCIYCSNGSGDFAGDKKEPLEKQFVEVRDKILKKWPNSKYIGYFQANTNTYADIKVLKEKYETILKMDDVVGLSIATRPDSITDECYDYLEELSKRTYLTVELGLQTIHEKTSKLINRCHDLECFLECVKNLRKRNINVVVHIINGLPYETKEMMLETVSFLNKLDIQGIKIHMLHILKGTPLALLYQKEKFHVLTKEEYVDIVCDQIEILREDIVINRITGDPNSDELIEPSWLVKKFSVLNEIDKELERRNSYQGYRKSILNYVHNLIDSYIKENDIVIDAITGNGNDTLYLCDTVSMGKVFGFDIQEKAIQNTDNLLREHKKRNYELFLESNEKMDVVLKEYFGKVSLVIFNLGYLPNGDKSITTNYKTTIKGIKASLKLIHKRGMILLVIYPGHPAGKLESLKIKEYLKKENLNYQEYHNTDNVIAPYLIEIKKDHF